MNSPALDKFGSLLMKCVRDKAISDWQMTVDGKMKSQRAQDIYQKTCALSPEQRQLFLQLIPQIVDTTLHHFLWTLEQEQAIELRINSAEGLKNIAAESDGLPGELYGTHGWIVRFSQQGNPY